jgi:hypothetical protein
VEDSQKVHLKGIEDEVKLMWEKLEGIHIQNLELPATRFKTCARLSSVPMSLFVCTFCEGTGHTQDQCYSYRGCKAVAIQKRVETLLSGGRAEQAELSNGTTDVTEFAGNATPGALAPCSCWMK